MMDARGHEDFWWRFRLVRLDQDLVSRHFLVELLAQHGDYAKRRAASPRDRDQFDRLRPATPAESSSSKRDSLPAVAVIDGCL